MKNCGIPICEYPTTVVLIDDDVALLSSCKKLISRVAPCVTFSDPREAVRMLLTKKMDIFLKRCYKDNWAGRPSESLDDFDENRIHQEIYHPERYQDMVCLCKLSSTNKTHDAKELFIKSIVVENSSPS